MSQSHHPHRGPGVLRDLGPAEVLALLRSRQALLIDVREPGEYEAERIPGALLYPLSGFDPRYLPLDGSRRIILQCGTGRRSAQAAQRLLERGEGETAHLAGGIKAWKEAGLPLTTLDPASGRTRCGHL